MLVIYLKDLFPLPRMKPISCFPEKNTSNIYTSLLRTDFFIVQNDQEELKLKFHILR